MNTTAEVNEYDILLEIFRFVRDYSTDTYTLSQVLKALVKHLTRSGFTVEALPRTETTSRIVVVNGHKYRLIRWKGWSKYDVIRTA